MVKPLEPLTDRVNIIGDLQAIRREVDRYKKAPTAESSLKVQELLEFHEHLKRKYIHTVK